MALTATHLRFALDLKDQFNISDIPTYLAGTLYPDSRYVSRLPRTATHECCFTRTNPQTDFEYGWWLHLLLDRIQKEYHQRELGDLLGDSEAYNWAAFTAIKVVQDIYDRNAYNPVSHSSAFEIIKTPNNESVKTIETYMNTLKDAYTHTPSEHFEDYIYVWRTFGIDEELITRILEHTRTFLNDSSVVERIRNVYPYSLEQAKQMLPE